MDSAVLMDAKMVGRWDARIPHFDVLYRDVVAIIATINGGVAHRNLMIPEFAKELGRSREELDKTGVHADITQLFYKTNLAVKNEVCEQVCELRTTCTKSLSLTKMFRPPPKTLSIHKCIAFRFF